MSNAGDINPDTSLSLNTLLTSLLALNRTDIAALSSLVSMTTDGPVGTALLQSLTQPDAQVAIGRTSAERSYRALFMR